ncbi:hypothetical protein BKP35_17280 [Anaerobacillus arseniciselenatis]|uniref:Thioredoxin domain-containing protein n=1 Tax=Anaerobacillus arseniciselenatis TaxID=85682 RepID=A0A1S2L9T4_9BACI|nr:hypothetical protein [Anaerobacillus arseniciselenatis]OIJ09151.1 hypothetical protein BKP35_17280 [Anaerobacillus arseniciselenatis]
MKKKEKERGGKMRVIIMILTFMLILTACSFGDNMNENKIISNMKAEEENQYHIYSFWTDVTEIGDFDYSRVDLTVVRLIAAHKSEHEYAKALKINEFPTFIVLDNEGIVLRTTNVNEMNEFLKDFQME